MTALAVLILAGISIVSAALGFFIAALMAAGKREDECRRCRRAALDQALREADGISYGGTDS